MLSGVTVGRDYAVEFGELSRTAPFVVAFRVVLSSNPDCGVWALNS